MPTYDKVVNKWDKYGEEVKVTVEKYEGKDYQTSKGITSEELRKLHSAGLYMYTNNVTSTRGADDITTKSGGSTDFVSNEDNGEGNVGLLLWVSRTLNEERVNYLGKSQYATVSKTFPEYYDKCGGTDMAFGGWANTPNPLPYDYTYNKVADGSFSKETQFKFLMDREYW